jgi:uncharacterized protein
MKSLPSAVRASQFNIRTVYERTGETLLFNTLTGAFCALQPQTAIRAEQLLKLPCSSLEDPGLASYLLDNGFLVRQDTNESEVVLERSRLGICDPNRLDLTIMPNMNCNFACSYCYESHLKSEMSETTMSRLMVWFGRTVPLSKVISLHWFGGEPLLSYARLIQIQKGILGLCEANGVDLSVHLTTNGYLLKPDWGRELISLGIRRYQITLDGAPNIHNGRRPLRGGGKSFERVMANLCDLVGVDKSVSVTLRVNFDEATLDHVPDLLTLFPPDVRSQIDVLCEPLFSECHSLARDEAAERVGSTLEEIYQSAKRLGFSVTANSLEPGRLTYCDADRRSQLVLNYNGDVFKCLVSSFESKDRLGWLDNNGRIAWEDRCLESWHSAPAFEEKCYSCKFMPLCMGGCRKLRIRDGMVGDDCKLPFMGFEKRLQYRYAHERGDSECPSSGQQARAVGAPGALFHILGQASH